MGIYRVTIRSGSRIERRRLDDLDSALAELETVGTQLQESADAGEIDLKTRRIQPVQQVVARLELSGPRRLQAGVDVRGDGSAEGYTGRFRRRLVKQAGGETPYEALRRLLLG